MDNNNTKETSLVKPVKILQDEETKTPYPKSVIFIIGNEFCERFSYYGMKAILTLYFVNKLSYNENFATMVYHIFSSVCYFTPIIGAIIADSFLGKFRTIFYISIIYAAGNIVLAISAMPTLGFDGNTIQGIGMLGLGLIAFGTGGIKPCVSAFGGDQFKADQERELQRFFSFFYIAINAGSLISTFITPMLRTTHCLGEEDCYSLAFGVPAILMVAALVLFLIGKPLYKIVPPKGNILLEVCFCIGYAIKRKCSWKGAKKENWLDYADDKYDRSLIEDIKPVLRVLKLYIPLPFYWALFDQQGSRWTLQATKMDGTVTSSYRIEPDQMQVVNPLLIILAIPMFEYLIYPAFAKIKFLVRPLQRMVVGGLLASVSFVIAFFLQLAIEKTLPVQPDAGFGRLSVLNSAPCSLNVSTSFSEIPFILEPHGMHMMPSIPYDKGYSLHFDPVDCPAGIENGTFSATGKENRIIDTLLVTVAEGKLDFLKTNDTIGKPDKGRSDVRIFFNDPDNEYNENSTFVLKNEHDTFKLPIVNLTSNNVGSTNYVLVYPGRYTLATPVNENVTKDRGEYTFQTGGNYIILISKSLELTANKALNITSHVMVEPSTVSLFLQIPQYVVLTFGEVMFSITGLEFSYSQAPVSMKSVLTAGWLVTVAFGNVIVVIVSELDIGKQSTEFIMFACLLAVVMLIFAVMAYFYKPVQQRREEEKNGHVTMNGKSKTNEAFVDDSITKM